MGPPSSTVIAATAVPTTSNNNDAHIQVLAGKPAILHTFFFFLQAEGNYSLREPPGCKQISQYEDLDVCQGV